MHPFQVTVDYEVLKANYRALQARNPRSVLVPVVKSDAYGHGSVASTKVFLEAGARQVVVFRIEEAQELRQAGIDCPIWVLLGPCMDEMQEAVALENLTLGVHDKAQALALSREAVAQKRTVPVHLVTDTGMGRIGFLPDQAGKAAREIAALPGLCLRGAYSHIAKAADPNYPVTQRQVALFRRIVAELPPGCDQNHLCAGEAFINGLAPELPYARPGIALYTAVTPYGETTPVTADAMSVRTRLVSVKRLPAGSTISYGCIHTLERDSVVGVALIGYDEGVPRTSSDQGVALVRGQRVPQLGIVCMGMIMLDLTDLPNACVDDEVVLIGKQGKQAILCEEFARRAGTITDEVICRFGLRR